jgi:hypothetical protein
MEVTVVMQGEEAPAVRHDAAHDEEVVA